MGEHRLVATLHLPPMNIGTVGAIGEAITKEWPEAVLVPREGGEILDVWSTPSVVGGR